MKITASQLRRIISEEVSSALQEADVDVSADTLQMIEDFVAQLRDVDPGITLGDIQNELSNAFRKNAIARGGDRSAARSAGAVKAAATRKADAARHREMMKKHGPTWPGQLHGAEKPAGWKKSDYMWDDDAGNWSKR